MMESRELIDLADEISAQRAKEATMNAWAIKFEGDDLYEAFSDSPGASWSEWLEGRLEGREYFESHGYTCVEVSVTEKPAQDVLGDGHRWLEGTAVIKWPHCTICGIIKRRDGGNSPCKGRSEITLREKPAQPEVGAFPSAKFDCHFDGDWNRCDKDCATLGLCKRRTSAPKPEQPESAEPWGYFYQHEETGRMTNGRNYERMEAMRGYTEIALYAVRQPVTADDGMVRVPVERLEEIIQVRGGLMGHATLNEKANRMSEIAAELMLAATKAAHE